MSVPMMFFVYCRRAGRGLRGLHILKAPPVFGAGAREPRDRMYTLCGYRSKDTGGFVKVNGVFVPRVVPKSIWAVCEKCVAVAGELEVMASASASREACSAARGGMLGYGRDGREDAPVGYWVLWVNAVPG